MVRKSVILVIISVLAGFAAPTYGQSGGNFGVGAIIGEPTGLSVKYINSINRSMNFAAAWSTGPANRLKLHADYVFYDYDLLNLDIDNGSIPLYYGIGAGVELAGDVGLGVRIPVGLNFQFNTTPIDIFFEIVPRVNFLPGTSFDVEGGLGVRYFF